MDVFIMKKRVIGLIPVRLKSKRLKEKPLLKISKFPMFVHVYKRAKISKKLNDLILCYDDKKIYKTAKNFNIKTIQTSKKHKNGTERIFEAYLKIRRKFDYIIDIQGDEPLLNPNDIDKVIDFHIKNPKTDIIVPYLKIKKKNDNKSLVKIVSNKQGKVYYFSRKSVPFNYNKKESFLKKHLSIISFKPKALKKYCSCKRTEIESLENIELMRAIEMNMSVKTFELKSKSFSVDISKDYKKANQIMKKDRYYKKYNF